MLKLITIGGIFAQKSLISVAIKILKPFNIFQDIFDLKNDFILSLKIPKLQLFLLQIDWKLKLIKCIKALTQ